MKVLIGIAPQGIVSFLSSAWVGRVSDKYLTEHFDVLKNLETWFMLTEDLTYPKRFPCMVAHIAHSSINKKKSQLSADDVHQTRKIAKVRIDVERVIGIV